MGSVKAQVVRKEVGNLDYTSVSYVAVDILVFDTSNISWQVIIGECIQRETIVIGKFGVGAVCQLRCGRYPGSGRRSNLSLRGAPFSSALLRKIQQW